MRITSANSLLQAMVAGKTLSLNRQGKLISLGKVAAWLFSHVRPQTFTARARQLPVSMENFIQNHAQGRPQGEQNINAAVQALRQQVANHYADNACLADIPQERHAEILHAVAEYCMARPTMPPLAEQTRIAAALNTVPPELHIDTACVRQVPPARQVGIFEQVCTFFARQDAPLATPEAQTRIAAALNTVPSKLHIDTACVRQLPAARQVEIFEQVCLFYADQPQHHPTSQAQQELASALHRQPSTYTKHAVEQTIQNELRALCAEYLQQDNKFDEHGILKDMLSDLIRNRIDINGISMTTTEAKAKKRFMGICDKIIPDPVDRKIISTLLCQCARTPLARLTDMYDDEFVISPGIVRTRLSTQGDAYSITLHDKITAKLCAFDADNTDGVVLRNVTTNILFPKNHNAADLTVTCEFGPEVPPQANVQEEHAPQ